MSSLKIWACFLLGCFYSFSILGNQSDSPTRVLSFQQLLDEMANCQDSVYTLENAVIQYDPERDGRFRVFDSTELFKLDTVEVQAIVNLRKVSFNNYPKGDGVEDNVALLFSMVHFHEEVLILNADIRKLLAFQACQFDRSVLMTTAEHSVDNRILFNNCYFKGFSSFNIERGNITSADCTFDPQERENSFGLDFFRFYAAEEESAIFFQSCHFVERDSTDHTHVLGKLYTLRFWRNLVETNFKFSEMSIEDITMINNDFRRLIDMTNVEFGNIKSELYYSQLGGKVGVYSNEDQARGIWRPVNYQSFSDSIAAERFFSTCRRLTEHFRNRGNLRDYNSMFTEMKDMETMQLRYYYEVDPSVQNWFSWRMNQFLGHYSDYGTNPIKAVLYALRVIAMFAIFYLFFQNQWDGFSKEKLMDRLGLISRYYRSEEGISELYAERQEPREQHYRDFYHGMKSDRAKLPKVFWWLSLPLYRLAVWRSSIWRRFLSRAEVLNGKWLDLPKGKRRMASFWGGLMLIAYLLTSFLVKLFNALMLSVNSFTTLGFGEIPTSGLARYAAIIEGFIGWFLLTLFSVSLITQLLQ